MNLKLFVMLLGEAVCSVALAQGDPTHWAHAPTPPLGWNSWDIFGTTVTERQVKEQADAMAEHLLPAGYDVLTVDIQWYEPYSRGHAYRRGAELTMDSYGRLTPALTKFPSAMDGRGFKPLADYAHDKGLRFGIHIMRGIPRQAVERNTPVLGADATAQDIALTDSTCPWNPDMFGVDATLPAGQAYYDSLFAMYAQWGVDYIKVDDIARPYDEVQRAEIEAIRRAIDKTGRPIVLSLSPGATPLSAGEHVGEHANLWRITDDFWDRWGLLYAMFERLDAWTPHRRAGAWPDADMIPLGVVDFGRPTRLTPDEQRTLMTLWSIARSPLIFGGDMTKLDSPTIQLLTNPEVLGVNQNSTNNRQVSRENDLIVWAADAPDGGKYVALFNAQNPGGSIDFGDADYFSPVIAGRGGSQEIEVSLNEGKRLVLFVRDGGDGNQFDHVAWLDPMLHGPNGDKRLTEVAWEHAQSSWGETLVNRTCEGRRLMIDGQPGHGIGAHADSTIIWNLPEGYESFTATGMVTHEGTAVFGVLVAREASDIADSSDVVIDLDTIGLQRKARVRDLWAQEDLGVVERRFEQTLNRHGAGLYRLTPVAE